MELQYQYAHYSHDESENKPIEDIQEALVAFDKFDWLIEAAKAHELELCSPSLALVIKPDKELIWVSAYVGPDELNFVSGCKFLGEVTGFLGFGKKQGIVNLDADRFSKEQAREAISLFISQSYDELRRLYKLGS